MVHSFKIKNYLGAVSFTLFKYLEIALSGISMLILAKNIGPLEMGESITSLLYITYSSYLALGMNSLIVKNYKKLTDKSERLSFLTLNIQYFLVVSGVNVVLAYYLLGTEYFMYVSLISIANLFRSFFMAYYRVIDKTWVLNLNNIVLSSFLLLGVFFYVNVWLDYLTIWAYISWICVLLFIVIDFHVFKMIFKNVLSLPLKVVLLKHVSDGVKLAIIGVVSTVLMTSDRLVLSHLDVSMSDKGSYQFADNISMAIFMGLSSIVFYYTPSWIDKVRRNPEFISTINKIINYGLLGLIPFLGVVFICSYYLREFWYSEYANLEYYIVVIIGLKLLLLLNGLGSLVFVGLDREKDYIKLMLLPVLLVAIGTCIIIYLNILVQIIFVPLSVCLVVFTTIFLQRRQWTIKKA